MMFSEASKNTAPPHPHGRISIRLIFFRRKRWRVIAILGVVILGTLWISRTVWLPWMYTYLDVGEVPVKADFIVVLGGSSSNRDPEALRLYQQQMASSVIIGGCGEDLTSSMKYFAANGVPEDAMFPIDNADSTWHEAGLVFALLRSKNASSALIVTDGFHIRRAKATYEHLQGDPPIELTFVTAPGDYSADDWWKNQDDRSLILLEYLKMPYYCLRYGVCSWVK
jgi:uncharacterized SAM-binding protein YcdF (DUF218 family)